MEKMYLMSVEEASGYKFDPSVLLFFDRLSTDFDLLKYFNSTEMPFLVDPYFDQTYSVDRSLKIFEVLRDQKILTHSVIAPQVFEKIKEELKVEGKFFSQLKILREVRMREIALSLSNQFDVTISSTAYNTPSDTVTRREYLINLTLKKLPRLRIETDMQRLIDFKKDPESKIKLAELRNWITDITYTQYNQNEIEDKFEYLLMQYQDHMDRARLKYTLDSAEFWITAVPEIMNDLAHFKLGSAAKALFGFGKKELMLMEEERKAPGKELAFVYKAQREFGS